MPGAAALLLALLLAALPPRPPQPELYFLLMNQKLQLVYNLTAVDEVFRRAKAANYTGAVLYDHSIGALGSPYLTSEYEESLRGVVDLAGKHGLELVPNAYSFGHSDGIIFDDPALAEPLEAAAEYVVNGTRLALASVAGPLRDGAFEQHSGDRFTEWATQDQPGGRTFAADAGECRSGSCVRLSAGGDGNARLGQAGVAVAPVELVALRCWVRASNLTKAVSGNFRFQLNFPDPSYTACRAKLHFKAGDKAWSAYDWMCRVPPNTTAVSFYVGMWGSTGLGDFFVDDCSVAPAGANNLIRRAGAPLTVCDAADPTACYDEGADFDPVNNTEAYRVRKFTDMQNPATTPNLTLPASTRLQQGQRVVIRYYAVLVSEGTVGACLASPPLLDYLRRNAAQLRGVFGAGASYLLRYDEMRQMHGCAACKARAASAGELLAWHVNTSTSVLRDVAAPRRVFVFQDMFDPFANGNRSQYYLVDGPIRGAWKGIPRDVIVWNWNHRNGPDAGQPGCQKACETQSLRFFESLGLQQFITGYYGTGDGAGAAANELAGAEGVTGLLGMVYGSWTNSNGPPGDPYLGGGEYSQLEAYAASARQHW